MQPEHQPDEDSFHALRLRTSTGTIPRLPPAARLGVVVGSPSLTGPYVIRVKLPMGTRMMPHKHPEDRVYTVISGIFYIGLGQEFSEERLVAFPQAAS